MKEMQLLQFFLRKKTNYIFKNIFKKIDQVSKKLIKKKENKVFELHNMQNAPTYL